jgi:hypothetical protein
LGIIFGFVLLVCIGVLVVGLCGLSTSNTVTSLQICLTPTLLLSVYPAMMVRFYADSGLILPSIDNLRIGVWFYRPMKVNSENRRKIWQIDEKLKESCE